MPSGLFVNAAWWALTILAFNLNAAMKRLALGERWAAKRMKALRFHLIGLPGRVVSHARQLKFVWAGGAEALATLLDARERIRAWRRNRPDEPKPRAVERRPDITGVSDYVVGSTENRISGSNHFFSATTYLATRVLAAILRPLRCLGGAPIVASGNFSKLRLIVTLVCRTRTSGETCSPARRTCSPPRPRGP